MKIEITRTDPRERLLLAHESPASVDDYIGHGISPLARCGECIAGACVLLHTRPFTAEVVNPAAAPEYRRQDIGWALLAPAVAAGRGTGFRILEIGTGNPGAGQIARYERCGFVRCGIDRARSQKYSPGVPPRKRHRMPQYGASAQETRLMPCP